MKSLHRDSRPIRTIDPTQGFGGQLYCRPFRTQVLSSASRLYYKLQHNMEKSAPYTWMLVSIETPEPSQGNGGNPSARPLRTSTTPSAILRDTGNGKFADSRNITVARTMPIRSTDPFPCQHL